MNTYEKSGYLKEDFQYFHLHTRKMQEFQYHYHDFHKIIVFLSGKVTYHIEGKAYQLKPWDILLVNRHAIHRPEIDPSVPYERFILWIQNDIPWQELLKCFQKANDRSFSLIRLDTRLMEQIKSILYELETAISGTQFGDQLLKQALFTEFMVHVNRIFLQKQYITDQRSYSSDSHVEQLVAYMKKLNQSVSEAVVKIGNQ